MPKPAKNGGVVCAHNVFKRNNTKPILQATLAREARIPSDTFQVIGQRILVPRTGVRSQNYMVTSEMP